MNFLEPIILELIVRIFGGLSKFHQQDHPAPGALEHQNDELEVPVAKRTQI